jgi:FlaA1/EpsC-like NDP-sugar epimerase
MGDPVRIADVAHRLVAVSGRTRVDVVYTGLRGGEKLHEILLGEGEEDERPVHPLVSHVQVPPLEPERAWSIDALAADRPAVTEALRSLCYEPAVRTTGEL